MAQLPRQEAQDPVTLFCIPEGDSAGHVLRTHDKLFSLIPFLFSFLSSFYFFSLRWALCSSGWTQMHPARMDD